MSENIPFIEIVVKSHELRVYEILPSQISGNDQFFI